MQRYNCFPKIIGFGIKITFFLHSKRLVFAGIKIVVNTFLGLFFTSIFLFYLWII